MQEFVIQNSKGNDVTTSLIVAQVFGKNHKDVLRDIEKLSCSDDFRVRNFAHTPYTHPQNGQVYHYYEMTKDGFSFLVMGYTGAKAGEFKERFIAEFNKREAMLKSDDYILMRSQQILQGRLELAEKNLRKVTAEKEQLRLTAETQEQQLKEQAPKVDYYDKVIDSTGLQTTNMIASCFGISPIKLNKLLCAWGVQYKHISSTLSTATKDMPSTSRTPTWTATARPRPGSICSGRRGGSSSSLTYIRSRPRRNGSREL